MYFGDKFTKTIFSKRSDSFVTPKHKFLYGLFHLFFFIVIFILPHLKRFYIQYRLGLNHRFLICIFYIGKAWKWIFFFLKLKTSFWKQKRENIKYIRAFTSTHTKIPIIDFLFRVFFFKKLSLINCIFNSNIILTKKKKKNWINL